MMKIICSYESVSNPSLGSTRIVHCVCYINDLILNKNLANWIFFSPLLSVHLALSFGIVSMVGYPDVCQASTDKIPRDYPEW